MTITLEILWENAQLLNGKMVSKSRLPLAVHCDYEHDGLLSTLTRA
jgi:hypothetical protein